jgi:outer membrane protein OmpA-like peptidoglycan-associated protein
MKSIFYALFILFVGLLAEAQNLVLNPSVEELSGKFPTHWKTINLSPDIFTKGEEKNNFNDQKIPYDFGNSFLGVMSATNWSEIIQAELKEPLVANNVYQIKVQACKHSFCPSGFFNLEVAFTKGSLKPAGDDKTPQYKLPFVNLYCANMDTVKTRDKWTEFVGFYTAKGGEKYISLGRFSVYFKEDKTIRQTDYDGVVYEDNITRGCTYLYYDSLVVNEYKVPYKKPIILENIFFETNKNVLLPASYTSLNRLYSILVKLPGTKIKITGHTDNVGNANDNLKLSKDRAVAVQNYLIKKGIAKDRIKSDGVGNKKPIGNNGTKEGREQNRRVELEYFQ